MVDLYFQSHAMKIEFVHHCRLELILYPEIVLFLEKKSAGNAKIQGVLLSSFFRLWLANYLGRLWVKHLIDVAQEEQPQSERVGKQ